MPVAGKGLSMCAFSIDVQRGPLSFQIGATWRIQEKKKKKEIHHIVFVREALIILLRSNNDGGNWRIGRKVCSCVLSLLPHVRSMQPCSSLCSRMCLLLLLQHVSYLLLFFSALVICVLFFFFFPFSLLQYAAPSNTSFLVFFFFVSFWAYTMHVFSAALLNVPSFVR